MYDNHCAPSHNIPIQSICSIREQKGAAPIAIPILNLHSHDGSPDLMEPSTPSRRGRLWIGNAFNVNGGFCVVHGKEKKSLRALRLWKIMSGARSGSGPVLGRKLQGTFGGAAACSTEFPSEMHVQMEFS